MAGTKPKNLTKQQLLDLLREERTRCTAYRMALVDIAEAQGPAPATMLQFIAKQALDTWKNK